MVKDIEKEFFKAFEPHGILDYCFEWMADEYDLGFKYDKNSKAEPKAQWNKLKLDFHNCLQPTIIDRAEKFEDRVISFSGYHITDAPLMVEISNNLDECKGDERAIERYIHDLLTPFRLYSDIMHPIDVIERYQAEIEECQKNLQDVEQKWPDGTMKQDQIKAYKHRIERWQFQIERTNYVVNRYREILSEMWNETGTVVYYLDCFLSLIRKYALALDVLLLKRGINLLFYQQECGIYLFEYRSMALMEDYLGGRKLAQKYIDEALPKLTGKPKHPDNGIVLPDELNTQTALKYFAKAVEEGFMEQRGDHYKWVYNNGSKVSLGRFLEKVYCPNNTEHLPLTALEKLFGIKRLDRAVDAFHATKQQQKWLPPIDGLFDD